MKRYLLFAGSTYYASGGWNDFVEDFDTYEEAWAHYHEANKEHAEQGRTYPRYDWGHAVDSTNGRKHHV